MGPSHPPRKKVVNNPAMMYILEKLASWKVPKSMLVYSVCHPATISLSASGMSKGILSSPQGRRSRTLWRPVAEGYDVPDCPLGVDYAHQVQGTREDHRPTTSESIIGIS